MYQIENDELVIHVNSKGAELSSLFSKATQLEYMWNGDPAYWGKKSPVLFPVVGALKNDRYYYNGQSYSMGRHGFAREMDFELISQTPGSLSFALISNEDTLLKYPFRFRFEVNYSFDGPKLAVNYRVVNNHDTDMFFSVGGHPAFRLPLEVGLSYSDYYFRFSQQENADRWMVSSEGLISPDSTPVLTQTDTLPISRELFSRDAVVLKHINSDIVSIVSQKSERGVEFGFNGFPFLGLWSAPNADFVCIEPWCGIADSTDTNQQLVEKEGIQRLSPGETFSRSWWVRPY